MKAFAFASQSSFLFLSALTLSIKANLYVRLSPFCLLKVPIFLMALMTEVFIVSFTIQSFTLHLGIDWISMFETLIWILYLVMPTFAVVYVRDITL